MQNRIKQLRVENNITQVRLSIELEVTQETVSAYEIGKHSPSVKSLLRMASLFDVSIDYILGLSDIRKASTDKILSQDESKFILLYRKMNPHQKEKILAFMQGQLSNI